MAHTDSERPEALVRRIFRLELTALELEAEILAVQEASELLANQPHISIKEVLDPSLILRGGLCERNDTTDAGKTAERTALRP